LIKILLGVLKIKELMDVQKLISEATVEAFNKLFSTGFPGLMKSSFTRFR